MKLTEWYPAHIKPLRIGVYETIIRNHKAYQYWDGTNWHIWYETIKDANKSIFPSIYQDVSWRGVAK